MDPSKTERKSTTASGILLVALLAAIIGVSIAVVMNPSILENVAIAVLLVVLALVVVGVLAAIFAGILAIPFYMKKGVVTQTDMSYDLDDVKEVDGVMEKKE